MLWNLAEGEVLRRVLKAETLLSESTTPFACALELNLLQNLWERRALQGIAREVHNIVRKQILQILSHE